MDFFSSTELSVPVMQVALLLILSTVSLLAGRLKLALFINYCFTLYWGYIANTGILSAEGAAKIDNFTFIYFGFGIIVALLAMVGLMMNKN